MLVALAGGVGGAKLSSGLASVTAPSDLAIIVNTGDDFAWQRLWVCPDLDTVTYTLAGIANPDTGWGISGDTFSALEMLSRLDEDPWFKLGDRDIAVQVFRTRLLAEGQRLTSVVERIARSLGVGAQILPMCDERVSTMVCTDTEVLDFQTYFVRRRHTDRVVGIQLDGIETASVTPEGRAACISADAIIICPSNPYVSILPILSVPGMRDLLLRIGAPIVAVSPIVGGEAIKGPAADMLASIAGESSAVAVARMYADFVDGFVLDNRDAHLADTIRQMGIEVLVADTIMHSDEDRAQLAGIVRDFACRINVSRVEKP